MTFAWFFFAVVSGAAFVSTLTSLTKALKNRYDLKPYPAAIVWRFFLLVLILEIWVATAHVASSDRTNIGQFAMFLVLPVGILVLEELVDYTSDEELDAQSYFNRQRVPFFTVLVALPILSILRQMFLGELQLDGDLWFQIALIVAAGTGFFIRSRRGDTVLALVMLALIVVYLGVEYPNVSVEKSFELP